MSINVAKWTLFLSLCFENYLLLALDFLQLPCWDCLELFPFLAHCSFCIQNFHRLGHWNKFVNQIVMTHRSETFACNEIFVIFRKRRFQAMPCGFMRFHYATLIFWESFGMQYPALQAPSWC